MKRLNYKNNFNSNIRFITQREFIVETNLKKY